MRQALLSETPPRGVGGSPSRAQHTCGALLATRACTRASLVCCRLSLQMPGSSVGGSGRLYQGREYL